MNPVKKPALFSLSFSIVLLAAGILTVRFSFLHPVLLYTITFIGTSCIYCWMCWLIFRIDLPKNYISLCLGLAICLRLFLLTLSPIGSDDIYRYMWDGKVQASGINPYAYAPDSDSLAHLHSDTLPASINHPNLKTLYLPLSEWVFFLCYHMSGEAVWAYKLLLLLSDIAVLIGFLLLARRLQFSSKFILFYALCPLSLFQFALDSHLDGLGFPFLLFCLLAYVNKQTIRASIFLGLSISFKPVGLVLLPFFILHEREWKRRLELLILPISIVLVQFLPYLFSAAPWDALSTFAKHWTFNGIVFESFNIFFNNNQKARLVCAVVFGIFFLLLLTRRKPFFEKLYYGLFLLLIFSPVVHPWYIAWILVFLPLLPRWSGIIFAATASLTSLTILNYKMSGVWMQEYSILLIEYLPVLILLFFEYRNSPGIVPVLEKNTSK